ncbi:MAG: hypothetical protein GY745_08270 [Actinomycetia bacterium]|nr:hypothetical protein [Actinomycetes bacterium]
MASIQSRTTPSGERRWDVYYRGPDGKQRKKAFKRKVDAQRYANTVEADIVRHDWVDPQRGRDPFGNWAEKWIGTTTHLKPKTRESYESILRNHLIPEFGDRAIGSIDHPEVLSFLSRLASDGRGAGTVPNIRDVMRSVFKLAVRAGVVKNNPVLDIKAPRAVKQEMIFLTEDQVLALADEIQNPPPLQRGHRTEKAATPTMRSWFSSPPTQGSEPERSEPSGSRRSTSCGAGSKSLNPPTKHTAGSTSAPPRPTPDVQSDCPLLSSRC